MMLPSNTVEPALTDISTMIDGPGARLDGGGVSEEPSLFDGILGGGPLPALYEAFSHYTDGIDGGGGLLDSVMELPDSVITGPQAADDDDLLLPSPIMTGPSLEMF